MTHRGPKILIGIAAFAIIASQLSDAKVESAAKEITKDSYSTGSEIHSKSETYKTPNEETNQTKTQIYYYESKEKRDARLLRDWLEEYKDYREDWEDYRNLEEHQRERVQDEGLDVSEAEDK